MKNEHVSVSVLVVWSVFSKTSRPVRGFKKGVRDAIGQDGGELFTVDVGRGMETVGSPSCCAGRIRPKSTNGRVL